MNKSKAISIAHTLSKASKMPGDSYSLPATACKTGSKLRLKENSVCSKCYARKGNYGFPSVQAAMEKRRLAIKHPDWVDAMVTLIGNQRHFRWHDSGDIQNVTHLRKIIAVAKATPKTMHWLPSKEAALVAKTARDTILPDNLIIRVSLPMINSQPLKLTYSPQVKTCRSVTPEFDVGPDCTICPAPQQDNQCADCRLCWDTNVEDIAYLMH